VAQALKYKGYSGSAEFSLEDECLHGRIQFIDDLITYEAETVLGLNQAFKDAVDRYLAYCEKTGNPANKPFSGTFNIRTAPETHRRAAQSAFESGVTLNEWVGTALERALNFEPQKVELNHHHTHTVHVTVDQGIQSWVASTNNSTVESGYAH
jgi:predicted HicB family RNase H-like nuclease